MRDYYYILGIDSKATEQEIKTAYRKLSLKFHPDTNNGEKFFEERFKAIQEAYEVLSNAETRSAYDYKLRQFRSSHIDSDELKAFEESLKRKFEEELKKKEEEIKKKYQYEQARAGANTSANASTSAPKESNDGDNTATGKSKDTNTLAYVFAFLLCFIFAVVGIIVSLNKEDSIETDPGAATIETPHASNDHVDSFSVAAPVADSVKSPEPLFNTNNIMLVLKNNQTVPLSRFPVIEEGSYDDARNKSQIFVDLDSDNVPELITEHYTGGAHCCYVHDIFVQQSKDTYRQVFSFTGGLSVDGGIITLTFYEDIGYFHACYACGVENMPNNLAPQMRLRYENNRFVLAPTAEYLNYQVTENLDFLSRRAIPDISSGDMDDGTRKEYAVNMATWHFNNGADFIKTRAFFDRYYTHSDKESIWNELTERFREWDKR